MTWHVSVQCIALLCGSDLFSSVDYVMSFCRFQFCTVAVTTKHWRKEPKHSLNDTSASHLGGKKKDFLLAHLRLFTGLAHARPTKRVKLSGPHKHTHTHTIGTFTLNHLESAKALVYLMLHGYIQWCKLKCAQERSVCVCMCVCVL